MDEEVHKTRIEEDKGVLVLVCKDETRVELTLLQTMLYRAGTLNLDMVDRQHISEPRKRGWGN